jgi:hypothetical protein
MLTPFRATASRAARTLESSISRVKSAGSSGHVSPHGRRIRARNASLTDGQKLEGRMNPSINKRQKERDRQERQRAKAEIRKQRREEKNSKPPTADGEDPDIAGIVPGPQPPAEE